MVEVIDLSHLKVRVDESAFSTVECENVQGEEITKLKKLITKAVDRVNALYSTYYQRALTRRCIDPIYEYKVEIDSTKRVVKYDPEYNRVVVKREFFGVDKRGTVVRVKTLDSYGDKDVLRQLIREHIKMSATDVWEEKDENGDMHLCNQSCVTLCDDFSIGKLTIENKKERIEHVNSELIEKLTDV